MKRVLLSLIAAAAMVVATPAYAAQPDQTGPPLDVGVTSGPLPVCHPGPFNAHATEAMANIPPTSPAAKRCQATPTSIDLDRPAPADYGYGFVGQETSAKGWAGVQSRLQTVNSNVVHGYPRSAGDEFTAMWVMADDRAHGQFTQHGYAEVSWRDDARHVFQYDTNVRAYQWYDQFTLADGTVPFYQLTKTSDLGYATCWDHWIAWNGVWSLLKNTCLGALTPDVTVLVQQEAYSNSFASADPPAIPPHVHDWISILSPAYGWIPWANNATILDTSTPPYKASYPQSNFNQYTACSVSAFTNC